MMIHAAAADTFTTIHRDVFALMVRTYRAKGTIRTYSRFGRFGRVIITREGWRIVYRAYTSRPDLNLHYPAR